MELRTVMDFASSRGGNKQLTNILLCCFLKLAVFWSKFLAERCYCHRNVVIISLLLPSRGTAECSEDCHCLSSGFVYFETVS